METLQRTANRGSISTGPYQIDNSLKLEADNSENLYRNLNASTSTTKFTISMWFKRTELGGSMLLYNRGVAGNESVFLRTSTETNDALQVDIGASTTNSRSYTSQLLRDTSAWYHVVLAVDTTQSTATDRFKLYLNGNLITDFASRNNPAQNFAMEVSSANHRHGAYNDTEGYAGYNGYIAEVHYVDGSQEAQTEFGEFDDDSGIWKPKQYTGSYGTGGYYLDFSDSSALGNNSAGDGTDFTLRNITSADQTLDVPTNNFCVGNALVNFAPGGQTLSQGAAKFSNPSGQNWQTITGTFGLSAGKWYWEFESDGGGAFVGIADVEDDIIPQNVNGYFLGYGDDNSATTNSLGMYSANGVIYNDNSGATGSSYGSGNRVGVALDMDNEKIYFAVDNNWVNSANPAAGTGGATWNSSWSDTVFPAGSCAQNNSIFFGYGGFPGFNAGNTNLTNTDSNGYGAFLYSPPSGFYALSTKNLAEYG